MDASLPPPPLPVLPEHQQILDAEHLRLLSIFYYVVGGMTVLFSCIAIFHIIFGLAILANPRFFESSRYQFTTALASPSPAETPSAAASGENAADATPAPALRRHRESTETPPRFVGGILAGFGLLVLLLGWTVGGLTIYTGYCIARRRRRVFSMVIAGINCLHIPFGTALGVFTFIVMQRPSVMALYAAGESRK